jgi:hypothetical protein
MEKNNMKQFCKDLLDFLWSEYNDAYEFKLELRETMTSEQAELRIRSDNYTRVIASCYMQYFYRVYLEKEYIQERKQFKWQKELIDLIEGS